MENWNRKFENYFRKDEKNEKSEKRVLTKQGVDGIIVNVAVATKTDTAATK
jgi:hypothetical protein